MIKKILWISVKERLPKSNKDVFVWDYRKKEVREDYYCRFDGGGWANSNQDSITHWISRSEIDNFIKSTIPKP